MATIVAFQRQKHGRFGGNVREDIFTQALKQVVSVLGSAVECVPCDQKGVGLNLIGCWVDLFLSLYISVVSLNRSLEEVQHYKY